MEGENKESFEKTEFARIPDSLICPCVISSRSWKLGMEKGKIKQQAGHSSAIFFS
jgi:hypothetical protein